MAPGAFSILAPFLCRKSKTYEKLKTEDPEKKKQEATQEEINRLNVKISKLVSSMSREDLDLATSPQDACVMCCYSRASMLVVPCNHQCLCRLCFVHHIKDAVANRDLPLRCVVCNAKIFRVKNNSQRKASSKEGHSVPPQGFSRNYVNQMRFLPKSVSGYSLCAFNEEDANNSRLRSSSSSYSMGSALSAMSYNSNRSVRSTTSSQSGSSKKSKTPSWFSIGSVTAFQAPKIVDDRVINTVPRPHSLSSIGKGRQAVIDRSAMTHSVSDYSVKQWEAQQNPDEILGNKNRSSSATNLNYSRDLFQESRQLSKSEIIQQNWKPYSTKDSSQSPPLSPRSIDERIRAVQSSFRYASISGNKVYPKQADLVPRDNFRIRFNQKTDNLNCDNHSVLKGQLRRHSTSLRFSKSPDLMETTFSMTTIHEEQEMGLPNKTTN